MTIAQFHIKSGIYQILNKINGKKYIGSTSNVRHRKNDHFNKLRKNKHHSPKLQAAWNKYGEDNFEFKVLARCPKEYLPKLEQWFIDECKPEYNCALFVGGLFMLGRKLSVETIQKRHGRKLSEERLFKLRTNMLGKHHTEETKKKMSDRQKGKKYSAERCRQMSEIMKGKPANRFIPIVCYNVQSGTMRLFPSALEASRRLGVLHTSIRNNMVGLSRLVANQYIFKKASQEGTLSR